MKLPDMKGYLPKTLTVTIKLTPEGVDTKVLSTGPCDAIDVRTFIAELDIAKDELKKQIFNASEFIDNSTLERKSN